MAYNTFNPIVYKGLVLYLDAENLKSYSGSGLNWYDLTSNGNNGVLTNGATFSLSGNSIQFDGVDDYVDLGNIIQNYTEFTTSIWLNYNFFDSGHRTPIGDNGQDFDYHILFFGGTLWLGFSSLYTGDAYIGFTHGDINIGTWYNFVITKDVNNDIKFYQNSIYFGGGNKQGAVNINKIGSGYVFDNVKVSNILFYNRALTPAEILQNYNATKWRFMNEDILPSIVTDQLVLNLDAGDPSSYPGSGTSWYDLTANSHNGTLTNGAYYDPSDSGVMIFDGINDYVNVGSLGSGFGSFTLDMWFNSGSVTDYKNIIDFNGWNTGLRIEQYSSPGYYLNWPNNGYSRARMAIIINITDGFFGFGADCPGVITDNTWYNLVVTFDGDYCSIYINNEKLVDNYLVPSGFVGYINNMRIGDGFDYSGRRFQGKIPVVRIYDKALTSTEVLQNFNAQKNRYGL